MGHQANFYATPPDIAEIEASVRKLEPMIVLHDRSPTMEPRRLSSLQFTDESGPLLFYYLVRHADLSEVVTHHVPAQGYWCVDVLRSPVVEFKSCYFEPRLLRRGRVYYVDGFYNASDTWTEKPETFRRWATSVLKAIKKALKRQGIDYIGPNALTWLEQENGRLDC